MSQKRLTKSRWEEGDRREAEQVEGSGEVRPVVSAKRHRCAAHRCAKGTISRPQERIGDGRPCAARVMEGTAIVRACRR